MAVMRTKVDLLKLAALLLAAARVEAQSGYGMSDCHSARESLMLTVVVQSNYAPFRSIKHVEPQL